MNLYLYGVRLFFVSLVSMVSWRSSRGEALTKEFSWRSSMKEFSWKGPHDETISHPKPFLKNIYTYLSVTQEINTTYAIIQLAYLPISKQQSDDDQFACSTQDFYIQPKRTISQVLYPQRQALIFKVLLSFFLIQRVFYIIIKYDHSFHTYVKNSQSNSPRITNRPNQPGQTTHYICGCAAVRAWLIGTFLLFRTIRTMPSISPFWYHRRQIPEKTLETPDRETNR